MRYGAVAASLLAALLAAGCQTESRAVGPDAVDAAAKGGWNVSAGGGGRPEDRGGGEKDSAHDVLFDPPARDAADVVSVPVEAYAPIDRFFDNEGYLLGDRVVIDCSFEPFMARFIGLAYADESGKFVIREEKREGDIHTVRLWNAAADAANYQANLLPRVTFGSQHGISRDDPRTGRLASVNTRPFFEILGTEEIIVRFHMTTSRDRPVFFRAVARGTPGALRPEEVKDCVYLNANRRRRTRGPALEISMEIRRDASGTWRGIVDDPGGDR